MNSGSRDSRCLLCFLVVAAVIVAPGGRARSSLRAQTTITFEILEDVPGGEDSASVNGLSPDGSLAVGVGSSDFGLTGVTWGLGGTGGRDIYFLHGLRGNRNAILYDATSDGDFVGQHRNPQDTGPTLAMRGRGPSVITIGDVPGGREISFAFGATRDDAGELVVVGNGNDARGFKAFVWREATGIVVIGELSSSANAVSDDGTTVVGRTSNQATLWRGATQRTLFQGEAFAVNGDGTLVVGVQHPGGRPVIWREETGAVEPLETSVRTTGGLARDITADGRMIVGEEYPEGTLRSRAVLWMPDGQPLNLENLLRSWRIDLAGRQLLRAVGISDDGSIIVGTAIRPDGTQIGYRIRLEDCDGNGTFDALEHRFLLQVEEPAGALDFRDEASLATYGDAIAHYGQPWPVDHDEPGTSSDPASRLRVLGTFVCSKHNDLVLQRQRELARFEMLLGNEAYADAIDATVGLDGIAVEDLGDLHVFKSVGGIDSLLDEEIALLRGRELPGGPEDWIDPAQQFLELGGEFVFLYNRLPPNFGNDPEAEIAYRSAYRVESAADAARTFPQGHGDAFGYYLKAMKVWRDVLSADPELPDPEDEGSDVSYIATLGEENAQDLVDIGSAAAARARAALGVVERLFRRDYRERASEQALDSLFEDEDPGRAWSMGDWGCRGALGAYVDWALLSHVTPEASREEVPELAETAALAAEIQERVDAAGEGLDPLGLVHDAVPFGIDPSGLDASSGLSHYEQVRAAAQRAIDTSRAFLEHANEANQRLRDQDESAERFAESVADRFADLENRLIEILGVAPTGDPDAEAGSPDLRFFLLDDADLTRRGLGTRPAPGEVQLALSDLRVAGLRVSEARVAIANWQADVAEQRAALDELRDAAARRLEIVAEACGDELELQRRIEAMDEAATTFGLVTDFVKGIKGAATGNAADLESFFQRVVSIPRQKAEAEIARERIRIQCWKESELRGLDDQLTISSAARQLRALIRQSPQLLLNLATAAEIELQALGRLDAAVHRGLRLLEERERLEARVRGDLEDEAFRDLAFRNFRNRSLEQYGTFFDIAARYVVLAARAFAYEFNTRFGENELTARIYSMRTLGSLQSRDGGLQAVLNRLDDAVVVNNFNRPLESLGERVFSLRRNLLGIGNDDFPDDDLRFRSTLEGSVVQRLEESPFVRDAVQLSRIRDFGPAIVIPFSTELAGRNVFGEGPEPPFGNTNFSVSRNAKIRSFAIRFDGVEADLGIDPTFGGVTAFLVPTGESMLRENTGLSIVEDEPLRAFAAFDVFLPSPRVVSPSDADRRTFNPWVETAHSGGNYLGALKRFIDVTGQVELGQREPFFNTTLAGRSLWNTGWLLIVPGKQWTSSTDPAVIRQKLLEFIWGRNADPDDLTGITDVRWIVQAYSH